MKDFLIPLLAAAGFLVAILVIAWAGSWFMHWVTNWPWPPHTIFNP